ncbi:MAG TPA: sulfite exporter TauE/SafE family protein [Candidatus Limnocylindria bacterium]|nr:sulfite exporter TauE/SafE family protein [Candidatus Limnocylindria bacterium]
MGLDLLLAASGLGAGLFGSILGLGGGVLIVPLLTLAFGYPLATAVATSLVCVIATSTGAAAHNVRLGRADVRLGLTLESGTVVGAVSGGLLAGFLQERMIAGLFAGLMAYTALNMGRGLLRRHVATAAQVAAAQPSAPDGPGAPPYRQHRLPLALAGSFLAGNVSGLLGIGGGAIKVPLVHLVMGAPLGVAVATSNFIIGVTAAAGAYAYLVRGQVDPAITGPVVLGVAAGAFMGARVGPRINPRWLTALFLVVVVYVAVEMAIRAMGA